MRRVALVAGILLLVAFLTFQNDSWDDGATKREERRVGVWFSPWLVFVDEESRPGDARSRSLHMSSNVRLEFLSWSWPVLAAAIALFAVSRRPAE